MESDIVARLRRCGCCDSFEGADEIERLRAALDAARIEVCMVRAPSTNASEDTEEAMRQYAASRGWDCMKWDRLPSTTLAGGHDE